MKKNFKKGKRLISLLLSVVMVLSLCACGGSGSSYGVNELEVLVEQEYSLAFRTDDPLYFYIVGALEVLAARGTTEELTRKWFGQNITSYEKNAAALDNYDIPKNKDFAIGVDIDSFPLAYASNGTFWGYDIELANAVCDLLGWNLSIREIEKENVYIELMSGNIDCAWGGIALDQEMIDSEQYMQYGPYMKNNIVVASRDSAGIWNQLKLSNKHMCMPTTTEATEALNSDPKLTKRLGQVTRLAGGAVECFEYLYSGKCDVILTDSAAVYYYNCH